MSAIEVLEKPIYNATGKDAKLVVMKPPKLLQKGILKKQRKQTIEFIADQRLGLPPQPTGYIKYPIYDWF